MDITPHLRQAIESTHVAFQGLSHPLRVVAITSEPAAGAGLAGARIIVETAHNESTQQATAAFTRAELNDEKHVLTTLAAAMLAQLQSG